MNIALIGLAGCGKSAAGKILAGFLKWDFVDTDEMVEKNAKQTIPEIFATRGESGFRSLESATLKDTLSQTQQVIATGGGVIIGAQNRRQLRENACVVYLTAPLSLLWDRLQNDPTPRPLLTDKKALADLAQQREKWYQQTAHLVTRQYETDTVIAVAEKIQAGLRHIITL